MCYTWSVIWSVTMTVRFHLFPFRTQQLSSLVPKIVSWKRLVKIGSRRLNKELWDESLRAFLLRYMPRGCRTGKKLVSSKQERVRICVWTEHARIQQSIMQRYWCFYCFAASYFMCRHITSTLRRPGLRMIIRAEYRSFIAA